MKNTLTQKIDLCQFNIIFSEITIENGEPKLETIA